MKYKELKKEIKKLKQEQFSLIGSLGIANKTVFNQMEHISMLNCQLEQQDKAIERKDMQFEGLKACYKDDLVNGRLG